ncbi:hypothetical protein CVS40_6573 [Lucilia cuprina]|nr:hypothetical protein CVS40_6573 [Lucilia cuprina]
MFMSLLKDSLKSTALSHGGLFHPLGRLENGLPPPLCSSMKNAGGNFCTLVLTGPCTTPRDVTAVGIVLHTRTHCGNSDMNRHTSLSYDTFISEKHTTHSLGRRVGGSRRTSHSSLTQLWGICCFRQQHRTYPEILTINRHILSPRIWEPQPTDQPGHSPAGNWPTVVPDYAAIYARTKPSSRLIGHLFIPRDCNNTKVEVSPGEHEDDCQTRPHILQKQNILVSSFRRLGVYFWGISPSENDFIAHNWLREASIASLSENDFIAHNWLREASIAKMTLSLTTGACNKLTEASIASPSENDFIAHNWLREASIASPSENDFVAHNWLREAINSVPFRKDLMLISTKKHILMSPLLSNPLTKGPYDNEFNTLITHKFLHTISFRAKPKSPYQISISDPYMKEITLSLRRGMQIALSFRKYFIAHNWLKRASIAVKFAKQFTELNLFVEFYKDQSINSSEIAQNIDFIEHNLFYPSEKLTFPHQLKLTEASIRASSENDFIRPNWLSKRIPSENMHLSLITAKRTHHSVKFGTNEFYGLINLFVEFNKDNYPIHNGQYPPYVPFRKTTTNSNAHTQNSSTQRLRREPKSPLSIYKIRSLLKRIYFRSIQASENKLIAKRCINSDDYLKNRTLLYETSNGIKEHQITVGVPQVSVLGPFLWNVMYDDLLNMELQQGAKLIGYALALVIIQPSTEHLQIVGNNSLRRCKNWLKEKGLELAVAKTEAILNIRNKALRTTKSLTRIMRNIGGPNSEADKQRRASVDKLILFRYDLLKTNWRFETAVENRCGLCLNPALYITYNYKSVYIRHNAPKSFITTSKSDCHTDGIGKKKRENNSDITSKTVNPILMNMGNATNRESLCRVLKVLKYWTLIGQPGGPARGVLQI